MNRVCWQCGKAQTHRLKPQFLISWMHVTRKIYSQTQSYSLLVEENSLDIYTELLIDPGILEKLQNQSEEVLVATKMQKRGHVMWVTPQEITTIEFERFLKKNSYMWKQQSCFNQGFVPKKSKPGNWSVGRNSSNEEEIGSWKMHFRQPDGPRLSVRYKANDNKKTTLPIL